MPRNKSLKQSSFYFASDDMLRSSMHLQSLLHSFKLDCKVHKLWLTVDIIGCIIYNQACSALTNQKETVVLNWHRCW